MWRGVLAVPALLSCLVLSPEIPQPENCRKQLLLALESPAVPLQNTLTLQFLLRHLGKVSQQAESNSLHPRALGEIFGPLLLRLPGTRYVRLTGSSHCGCLPTASASLHMGLNCWQPAKGGHRALGSLSAWDLATGMDKLTPASPLPVGGMGAAPHNHCSHWLLSPSSPELSPDFSVLFLEILLQTKELEQEQLPPGMEMPLPWGPGQWCL